MQSNQPVIVPLGAFMVVRLEDDKNAFRELVGRGPSEIELPGRVQGAVAIAKVLRVGPGHYRADGSVQPPDVKAGDRVLLMRAGLMPIDSSDDQVMLGTVQNTVAKIEQQSATDLVT